MTTDAWAEAERQLQAGVGIKEVRASPGYTACTTSVVLMTQWQMVVDREHTER